MAPGPEDSTQPQGGVLVRLLQLPMVSATRQVLQETYSSTKQTHPLICTVCGVYERGARKAGSLAVWTIQPAIHRLETHISAVDVLACKGLDRLEERIPALQYPPDKLAAGIAEMVTSTVQSAREGISRPFASTSDKALGVASSGYQLTWSAVSGGVDYVLNSAPVRLAGEGADTALTLTEHLVSYLLPASAEEMEKDTSWQQESDTSGDAVQPSYKRLGSLFAVVCRRTYDRTARGMQHTGARGRDLALSIPGVSPLAGFTWRNLEKAGGLALGLQNSVVGLVTGTVKQSNKEKRKKEGELLKLPGPSAEEGAEAVPPSKGNVPRDQVSNGSAQEQKDDAEDPGGEEGGSARPYGARWQSHQQRAPEAKGSQGGPRPASMLPQPESGRVEGTHSPGSSQVRMPPPTSHTVAKKD
ncbi:perilipin-1 isoform X1 [Paramormyrops kingsleyae]|uniref:perilipin-1 isoform X1 n=1 Tax=Paramormyrops kingsleyae TaxID=1676925 RepID=UPI003B979CD4